MRKDWYEVVDTDLTEAGDLLRRNEADGSGVEAVRKFVRQTSCDDWKRVEPLVSICPHPRMPSAAGEFSPMDSAGLWGRDVRGRCLGPLHDDTPNW